MNDALTLAKYIVSKCKNDGCPISNLQLQKILYFIQVKTLKEIGSPAFPEEIEAWKFGPVIPNVYYQFCGFGAMPIWTTYNVPTLDNNFKSIIDGVILEKRKLDPWILVSEAHKRGGAWDQIYREGNGNHKVIPMKLIKEVG